MENFLETNSNENSFFFLTLSNKNYKKCPAMENCKNSLDCFEYYADQAAHMGWLSKSITSAIEKFPTSESYHWHIMFDSNRKPLAQEDKPEWNWDCYLYDLLSYAEQHIEKYSNAEWKETKDKWGNPTITYSPAFKLKIVNTIENKIAVKKYIMKHYEEKEKILDSLLNLMITKYCKEKKHCKNRNEFMQTRHYENKAWKNYRDNWKLCKFSAIYIDNINLEE